MNVFNGIPAGILIDNVCPVPITEVSTSNDISSGGSVSTTNEISDISTNLSKNKLSQNTEGNVIMCLCRING